MSVQCCANVETKVQRCEDGSTANEDGSARSSAFAVAADSKLTLHELATELGGRRTRDADTAKRSRRPALRSRPTLWWHLQGNQSRGACWTNAACWQRERTSCACAL